MKSKLFFLTKYSLYKKINTKWFIIVNILLMIAIIAIANIDRVVTYFGGDFDKPITIGVIDKTNSAYLILENELDKYKDQVPSITNYKVKQYNPTDEKKVTDELKDTKNILVIIEEEPNNYIKAKIIANRFNDQILYQIVSASLKNTKLNIALSKTDIPMSELNKIYGPINIEQVALSDKKVNSMDVIMGTVFPTLILPFFMLVIFVIQMVGLEINEEKSTKSMEIIISNVSPQVHFFSKIIAANTFVIMQALLLVIYGLIGYGIRIFSGMSSLTGSIGTDIKQYWDQIVATGIMEQLIYVIPLTIILFILSFLLYSLIAGIFASITVNIEDYQQIQTPVMILLVVGYYLSMLAGAFEGSSLIRIASYFPFFSALLSPALLILNQITIFDVIISTLILLGANFLLIKYGIKIYKVGILNYSSERLWGRFSSAVKNRNKI